MNNRVLIYENDDFDKYVNQLQAEKLKSFSVSPSPAPTYYFSAFTLGEHLIMILESTALD